MAREKHPNCPYCEAPLFKAFQTGVRARKVDPYRFCRNGGCNRSGARGVVGKRQAMADQGKQKLRPPTRNRKRAARARARAVVETTPVPAPVPAEPPKPPPTPAEAVRVLVRTKLEEFTSGQPPAIVALFLAIALQETDNAELAPVLIAKHDLGELGLKS